MLSGRHKLASEQAEFSAYNFVLRKRRPSDLRARNPICIDISLEAVCFKRFATFHGSPDGVVMLLVLDDGRGKWHCS